MESKTMINRAQVAQDLAALDKEFAELKIDLVTEHTNMAVELQSVDGVLARADAAKEELAAALISLVALQSRVFRARDMIRSFSSILKWTGMAKAEIAGESEEGESEADLNVKATARVLLDNLGEEDDGRINIGGGGGE